MCNTPEIFWEKKFVGRAMGWLEASITTINQKTRRDECEQLNWEDAAKVV